MGKNRIKPNYVVECFAYPIWIITLFDLHTRKILRE